MRRTPSASRSRARRSDALPAKPRCRSPSSRSRTWRKQGVTNAEQAIALHCRQPVQLRCQCGDRRHDRRQGRGRPAWPERPDRYQREQDPGAVERPPPGQPCLRRCSGRPERDSVVGDPDRIEVLRDGASAIYGTDAIGGVINFITKREMIGLEVSAQATSRRKSGGGDTQRISSDGRLRFAVEAALQRLGLDRLAQAGRAAGATATFSKTGIIGTSRAAILNGTSGTAFPGDLNGFEPTLPNCDPPSSIPATSCRRHRMPLRLHARHRHPDRQRADHRDAARLVRAHARAHGLSLEYLNANNKSTARVAAAPTCYADAGEQPVLPGRRTRRRSVVIVRASLNRRWPATCPAASRTGAWCPPASAPAATTPPPNARWRT